MGPKPLRATTRKAAAELPEAARVNFLTAAAQLVSTSLPQLSTHLGQQALLHADAHQVPVASVTARSQLCRKCGSPLNQHTCSGVHISWLSPRTSQRLSKNLATAAMASKRQKGGGVSAPGKQLNTVVAVRVCVACHEPSVRPFLSLASAQQHLAKEGVADVVVVCHNPQQQQSPSVLQRKVLSCREQQVHAQQRAHQVLAAMDQPKCGQQASKQQLKRSAADVPGTEQPAKRQIVTSQPGQQHQQNTSQHDGQQQQKQPRADQPGRQQQGQRQHDCQQLQPGERALNQHSQHQPHAGQQVKQQVGQPDAPKERVLQQQQQQQRQLVMPAGTAEGAAATAPTNAKAAVKAAKHVTAVSATKAGDVDTTNHTGDVVQTTAALLEAAVAAAGPNLWPATTLTTGQPVTQAVAQVQHQADGPAVTAGTEVTDAIQCHHSIIHIAAGGKQQQRASEAAMAVLQGAAAVQQGQQQCEEVGSGQLAAAASYMVAPQESAAALAGSMIVGAAAGAAVTQQLMVRYAPFAEDVLAFDSTSAAADADVAAPAAAHMADMAELGTEALSPTATAPVAGSEVTAMQASGTTGGQYSGDAAGLRQPGSSCMLGAGIVADAQLHPVQQDNVTGAHAATSQPEVGQQQQEQKGSMEVCAAADADAPPEQSVKQEAQLQQHMEQQNQQKISVLSEAKAQAELQRQLGTGQHSREQVSTRPGSQLEQIQDLAQVAQLSQFGRRVPQQGLTATGASTEWGEAGGQDYVQVQLVSNHMLDYGTSQSRRMLCDASGTPGAVNAGDSSHNAVIQFRPATPLAGVHASSTPLPADRGNTRQRTVQRSSRPNRLWPLALTWHGTPGQPTAAGGAASSNAAFSIAASGDAQQLQEEQQLKQPQQQRQQLQQQPQLLQHQAAQLAWHQPALVVISEKLVLDSGLGADAKQGKTTHSGHVSTDLNSATNTAPSLTGLPHASSAEAQSGMQAVVAGSCSAAVGSNVGVHETGSLPQPPARQQQQPSVMGLQQPLMKQQATSLDSDGQLGSIRSAQPAVAYTGADAVGSDVAKAATAANAGNHAKRVAVAKASDGNGDLAAVAATDGDMGLAAMDATAADRDMACTDAVTEYSSMPGAGIEAAAIGIDMAAAASDVDSDREAGKSSSDSPSGQLGSPAWFGPWTGGFTPARASAYDSDGQSMQNTNSQPANDTDIQSVSSTNSQLAHNTDSQSGEMDAKTAPRHEANTIAAPESKATTGYALARQEQGCLTILRHVGRPTKQPRKQQGPVKLERSAAGATKGTRSVTAGRAMGLCEGRRVQQRQQLRQQLGNLQPHLLAKVAGRRVLRHLRYMAAT